MQVRGVTNGAPRPRLMGHRRFWPATSELSLNRGSGDCIWSQLGIVEASNTIRDGGSEANLPRPEAR
jgi:hypothetical protein